MLARRRSQPRDPPSRRPAEAREEMPCLLEGRGPRRASFPVGRGDWPTLTRRGEGLGGCPFPCRRILGGA